VSLFRRNFLEIAWRGIAVIHTGEVPPVVVRIKEALRRTATPVHIFSNRELEKAVRCYDAVVFAEALGGVVRLLCPLLRDKEVDPPVVVTDRLGRFFIPLIGAHRGANALAEELASLLGGIAVVTTAVEAAGALPPEDVERLLLCGMAREERLRVAAALRDGRQVCIAGVEEAPPGYKTGEECEVVIRRGNNCKEREICCKPLRLYVGVGFSSKATVSEIVEAVRRALMELGASPPQVGALVSIKPEVFEAAKALGFPAFVLKPEELRADWGCLSPASTKALETFGLPGVAEPAALTAAGPGAFLVYRKRVLGSVTVAVTASP
jgi:cobalt-precorrin 5A hydrolase